MANEDVITKIAEIQRTLDLESALYKAANAAHQQHGGRWLGCKRRICRTAQEILEIHSHHSEHDRGCELGRGHQQCCCNCWHRLIDFHHPWLTGLGATHERGFVCAVDIFRSNDGRLAVTSGWWEHSVGCEMYKPLVHGPVQARLRADIQSLRRELNEGT